MKPTMRVRSRLHRSLPALVLACALTGVAWISPSTVGSSGLAPTCRSADAFSANQITALGRVVSWTDSTSVRVRTALQLPQLSASAVTLVTQAQTCSKAAGALDAVQDTVNTNRVMYVFKLGNTRFAVKEVLAGTSGVMLDSSDPGTWFFTNKWQFLSRSTY